MPFCYSLPFVSWSDGYAGTSNVPGQTLSAADSSTIQCTTTRGVTYVPIPHVPSGNFAGLLTIDLPSTITHGEVFDIMVRRVATRRGFLPPPPPPQTQSPPSQYPLPKSQGGGPSPGSTKQDNGFTWRQVCGAFNVRIPVTNAAVMLPIEENTLALLKWRLQTKPAPYRWRPVWQRYIELVGAKVGGLGVDPGTIPPSLGGYPGKDDRDHRGHAATGKIGGVCYDRFGDFEGFDLRTEHGEERRYRAREEEMERLVLQAWRERWLVTVVAENRHERHDRDMAPWVTRLILRRTGI